MTVTAKPVLKNKFWIVEQEGVRVGTLSKEDDGFVMSSKSSVEIFKSESALKKKFGKDFLIAKIKKDKTEENVKKFTVILQELCLTIVCLIFNVNYHCLLRVKNQRVYTVQVIIL